MLLLLAASGSSFLLVGLPTWTDTESPGSTRGRELVAAVSARDAIGVAVALGGRANDEAGIAEVERLLSTSLPPDTQFELLETATTEGDFLRIETERYQIVTPGLPTRTVSLSRLYVWHDTEWLETLVTVEDEQ